MKSPSPTRTEILIVQPADAVGVRLRTALVSASNADILGEFRDLTLAVDAAARVHPDVLALRVPLEQVSQSNLLAVLRDVAPLARMVLHAFITAITAPGRTHWVARLVEVVLSSRDSAGLEARIELHGDPDSVPLARHLLTQLLGQWEMEDFVDLAALLITELVSNAICHVPGTCAVELTRRNRGLRISVVDRGPGMPDLQNPGISASGGRGLHIVAALADSWGVDRLDDGTKAVWAELTAPSDAAQHVDAQRSTE